MKIQKRLWIALVTFGLFAIVFSTWIYNQSTSREKLSFDGTVTFEATQEGRDQDREHGFAGGV